MASNNTSSGGIGFFGLLQVAFIILKLTSVIEWPWWMVFSPALLCAGIFAIILLVVVIAFFITK